MYVLHNLQSQLEGVHVLIFDLNSVNDVELFITFGTISHSFGPLKLNFSVPYFTGFTLKVLKLIIRSICHYKNIFNCFRI